MPPLDSSQCVHLSQVIFMTWLLERSIVSIKDEELISIFVPENTYFWNINNELYCAVIKLVPNHFTMK